MPRAQFNVGEMDNRCSITYQDDMGTTVTRDFFAPGNGGYVREDWDSPRQVCGELRGGGWTLMWDPKRHPKLVDLVREEWTRRKRRDRQLCS